MYKSAFMRSFLFISLAVCLGAACFALANVWTGQSLFGNAQKTASTSEKKTRAVASPKALADDSVYPRVASVTPANGAKDVVLGVEDPITVRFDRSTQDFFIKFVLDPEESVVYRNNPEKTEFQILPQQAIADQRHYKLTIFVKYRDAGDETLVKIFETSFDTAPPFTGWSKDFTERLEQARHHTKPKVAIGKYIDINLSTQVMVTFQDGIVLDAYLVSSGKRGMDTPIGEYSIRNKAPRPWSKQYSLYMPHWMALTADGKYGIHELPEWPGGYKEGKNHLGTPVSHGCVRLGVGPAKTVYDWAEVGTAVNIHK